MSLPTEMNAITWHEHGSQAVKSIPLPPLRPQYILVKTHSVALNPTDWKHAYYGTAASPFGILGCDYSGTVLQIGSAVTKSFKIGDKIYGCVHGGNFNEQYDGAFAEYIMVKGDVAMHIPEKGSEGAELDMGDLSTVGLGAITVGQGLFQPGLGFGLSLPVEAGGEGGDGEWIFVAGGSTATGSLAIQFLKLAGYKVVTTCSPRNFEFVKSRGADEIFDYNDKECGKKIRELTGDKLRYAWDTTQARPDVLADALSSDDSIAHYGDISGNEFPRENVKQTMTSMYTSFGEFHVKFGREWPADEEYWKFAKMWMGLTEKFVREGKVVPHRKQVGEGGLEGVLRGIDNLRAEKVSGAKLVYRISVE